MLPDFPRLKLAHISRILESIRPGAGSLASLASKTDLHEGNRLVIQREDGVLILIPVENHAVTANLDREDLRTGGLTAGFRVADQLREEMNQAITKDMLVKVQEACDQTGNTVDAKGSLSAEVMIDALEKMDQSFDENGNWIRPTVVFHPENRRSFEEELRRLEVEPNLKMRLNGIIDHKRSVWNAREARRKLVD